MQLVDAILHPIQCASRHSSCPTSNKLFYPLSSTNILFHVWQWEATRDNVEIQRRHVTADPDLSAVFLLGDQIMDPFSQSSPKMIRNDVYREIEIDDRLV